MVRMHRIEVCYISGCVFFPVIPRSRIVYRSLFQDKAYELHDLGILDRYQWDIDGRRGAQLHSKSIEGGEIRSFLMRS